MSAPVTPARLAEIRAWLAWEYRSSFGERGEQVTAELLAEVDRLRAQVAAVEALTGGPFSDGYRPYALNIDGEVVLAVGLDDLRAALAARCSQQWMWTVPDDLTGDLT